MTALRPFWKRFAPLAGQLALVVGLVVGVSAYQTRHHLGRELAPEVTLGDLAGNSQSLSQYRGKKVLIHFFATWCGVCRAELPSLRGLSQNLAPNEVLLAIVEDSDDVEAVRRFAREHELSYPILLGTRETLRAYRVSSFPTNYYVNGDGSIQASTVGLSTRLGMAFRLFLTRSFSAS
ncbi:MAG TPA: TlpA disulfide reductase family protein [Polyangiaceae bacterium]|nr:TlpA disulfide reductase family protein [Polyangiaceae bacterium]